MLNFASLLALVLYRTFLAIGFLICTGGGGGKGTWGKLGVEVDVDSTTTDIHDPNYDSDGQVLNYH